MSTPATQPPRIQARGLRKRYARPGMLGRRDPGTLAVAGASFDIRAGETLGLVGESGCGKSTTGRMVVGLTRPSAGQIRYDGTDVGTLRGPELRRARRKLQMVFQDPQSALSPRLTVFDIVAEPLRIQRLPRDHVTRRVYQMLDLAGIARSSAGRYSHEFSGGQRQRISIARALALGPDALVLDEPVSSLDVSIQAQIVNELCDLQREMGLSYLFISHDLAVIRNVSHRVAVMYLGRIVEAGPRDAIYSRPEHPYTKALLSANPVIDPDERRTRERIILPGDLPGAAEADGGCVFRGRCWKAREICADQAPTLAGDGLDGHVSACHFPEGTDIENG